MANEQQISLLTSMGDVLNRFDEGRLELDVLVMTLRGLYEAADFSDSDLRTEFEAAWVSVDHQNELRTESWSPANAATPEGLATAISKMRGWIDSALE